MAAVGTGGVGPAWRGGFGRLWSAAVISRFGDALRTTALPLLAVQLTDEPLVIASVTACGYLPWLLFGLLGGAVADRVDQRRAMWAVDTVRGLLVAAFALAVGLGHASVPLLLALAFLLTTLQTLFDNAATALLPSLVAAEALGGANARLMTGQQLAGGLLAGPFVPLLLGVGVFLPFAADAGTYLLAAALVASLRIRPPERPPRPAGDTLRAEIGAGLRHLWRDRVLRPICLATLLCNIGMGALIATLVLHVTRRLHAGTTGFAAAMTVYALGSLAGGFLARRIARHTGGRARALLLCGVVQTVSLLLMGTVRHLGALLAGMLLLGLMNMVWNVNQVTLMQQRSPAAMVGRIAAAFRTASTSGAPVGALLGGAAARAFGLGAPALLAALLFALAVAALIPAATADVPVGAPRGEATTADVTS
ncbi:Predicted arabinose efflux permease, MFS family [Streptomyces sp. yr375]|uniref:MFS transporter n=1 Tax=Streptomyces sp. yr375 TaxID=1761906 RepID=UPI0008BB07D0|nr:MFS transporter [Streptomyces sp. yr375]SEQ55986.1 Predicted arabinose efflux permease, MFS family [Streptomyces sp. yr375]